MKKTLVTSIVLILAMPPLFHPLYGKEEPVLLENKLLAMADGKAYGVTKEHIAFTLQIREILKKMLFGEKRGTEHVGIFTYQNKHVTIKDLRALEATYQESDIPAELTHTLSHVIEYFVEKILPFSQHAQGMQELMFSLIADSCTQRNRPDSFLFTWTECPHGKEAKLLHQRMTSFAALDEFISDLMNFLTDFVHSCPIARGQFITMIKEKNGHHHGNDGDHKN